MGAVIRAALAVSSRRAVDARFRTAFLGSALGVLALFLYSFTVGPYPIPVKTVVSVFLLAVDDLARAPGASEIPLGILTALIGAPFFVLALARTRKTWL